MVGHDAPTKRVEEVLVAARTASGELGDKSVAGAAAPDSSLGDSAAPTQSLPTGLVTFVMTDIEGSTRIFRKLGEVYVELLATHHSLLRDAFGNHGGVEVGTEGDSLLVAFPDAGGALAACLEGQQALAAQRWPSGAEVRVRMGVHTGEATPVGHDYVAIAVHQVARICSGAHGGQVLVSEATVAAAEDVLPPCVTLTAMGSFQLRGFPTPERLYQLRHPDLRDDFPPLRAIGVVAHNLPFLRASFVGRAEERAALADVLRAHSVVSVVGVGGVGKTRLAVQVAFDVMDRFADGAWLVELASVTDPASVPRAVAAALGVAEEPGRGIDGLVVDALAPKAVLLLLDNCEHLLDATARFAERLSQRCPHLVVLATSREPLEMEGEVVWRIGPLPTVDPMHVTELAEVAAADAVQLFVARAASVRPGFELTDANAAEVAQIVAHLNGIPLAVELAAAALSERSLKGVLDGLADRFSLLTGGRRTAPGRHQTLRAALEWSLDLLGSAERRLFGRLAVFAGGGTPEAAAAVCSGGEVAAGDVPRMIRHLARASLLVTHHEPHDRWSMLESVRELAGLELTAHGEAEDLAVRHRLWYADRIEVMEGDIGRKGHASIMSDLAADHDNVRRAIDTSVAAGDGVVALRICAAMGPFWTSHGDWAEGCERLRAALALSGGDEVLRGRAQIALGNMHLLRGELADAESVFSAALAGAAATGNDITLARALAGSGYVAFRHSELAEAHASWEQALTAAERAGDDRVTAGILRSLAIAEGSSGRQGRTDELLSRAIALAQRAEDDQLLRLLLGSSAELHLWLGHYQMAEDAYGEALALATAIGDLSARPLLLAELGWVALLRGDPATALRLSVEATELAEDLGNPRVLAHAVRLRGEALVRRGGIAEAAAAFDRALDVAEDSGAPAEVAGVRCSQACLALDDQSYDEARRLAEAAAELTSLGHPMRRISPRSVLGIVALIKGEISTAEGLFRAGLKRAVSAQLPRHQANDLWGLACVSGATGRRREAADLHRQALQLRKDIDDRLGVVDSLIGLAAVGADVDAKGAAQLVGAAAAMRSRAGVVPTPHERTVAAAALAAVAERANPILAAEHQERGAAMSDDAAVAIALRMVEQIGAAPQAS